MADSGSSERLWTPANIVTIIRICLVPVFVVALISPWPQWFGLTDITNETKSLIAAGLFIVISCTDWIDGYLARSRQEVTDFGKFMDPLADKILVAAALLALVELSVLPSWPVLIILAREFIVSGVRMVAASKGVVIAASWYGKAKTVTQIIAVVLFLIKDSLSLPNAEAAFTNPLYVASWAVMIVALFLTILSMLDYLSKARNLIGLGKSSASEDLKGEESTIEELAQQVITLATEQAVSLGTAESLTGGLIAAALTSVPGSSAVVKGGIASYAISVKELALKVPSETIETFGVVSEETAQAMAGGAQSALECDLAVAVTGIAGPSGAEAGKPVGTVCFALATPLGIKSSTSHFDGDRESVREQTVSQALGLLKDYLSEKSR